MAQRIEQLVGIAVAADPELSRLTHRLRPRFQRLMGANEQTLMQWGQQDVDVLTATSKTHAAVMQRVSQLSVDQWVHRCMEASTKPPGFFGRLVGVEKPDAYEARFRQLQGEMTPLISQLNQLVEELRPELEDLRLDVASMGAIAPRYTDLTLSLVINNRLRTLTAAQQSAAQLCATADASRQLLMQNCQKMDQLLSVTIPAWRLAQSR